MAEEKVGVEVKEFTLTGGHDSPPDLDENGKKKKKKKDEAETQIPQSEQDVTGLTYIEE